MPYRESWEDPEVFCTLTDGTEVYRTYPDDITNHGHLAFWFTFLRLASESCTDETDWAFDVRILPSVDGSDVEVDHGKRAIIQAAYDAGLLPSYMSCPGGCDSCVPLRPQNLRDHDLSPLPAP
jgi:hypothetical protein